MGYQERARREAEMVTQTVVELHWKKGAIDRLVVLEVQPAPMGVVLKFEDGNQRKVRFIPLDVLTYFDSWKETIPERSDN
jgi:hypothetical protein